MVPVQALLKDKNHERLFKGQKVAKGQKYAKK